MRHLGLFGIVLALVTLGVFAWGTRPGSAAATFGVSAGAESADMAVQINDFLPNALTVNVGDTVTWRIDSTEFHTVSFLAPSQEFPAFVMPTSDGLAFNPVAIFPAGGDDYDGTGYHNSGLLRQGETYSLTFTEPGTYQYLCLIHREMTAAVVVNEPGAAADDSLEVAGQITPQVADIIATRAEPLLTQYNTEGVVTTPSGEMASGVTAGAGDLHVAIMRFMPGNVTIHVGELVSWTNADPETPHTVTFLAGNALPELTVVTPQPGSAPMVLLNPAVGFPSGGDSFDGTTMVNSGLIGPMPEFPSDTFTLRFDAPGVFEYTCLLHDEMAMRGSVTVLP